MKANKANLGYFPVDWLKAEVIGLKKDQFLSNTLLDWKQVCEKGGVLRFEQADFQNIKIRIYPDGTKSSGIFFSGSLHKLANHGRHNYDDFTRTRFDQVIYKLQVCFGIKPQNLRLLQLEFGVNIVPPIDTTRILEHLFQLNNVSFTEIINNRSGHYKQALRTDYILKTYNKGKQYKLPYELLRIEVKQTNWSEYRRQGMITLSDFIQVDKQSFLNKLTGYFANCVFYDPTNKDANKWEDFRNAIYWRELRDNYTRQTFSRNLKELRDFNKKNGNDLQTVICELIREKLLSLQK